MILLKKTLDYMERCNFCLTRKNNRKRQRKMIKKKGVIFDMDGVICFTDQYHYVAWKKIADRIDVYFDESINHRLRGVSRRDSLEIILENSNRTYSEEEKDVLLEEKNDIYQKLLKTMSPTDLSEEVKYTLKELRERGYLLGIGSSSKNTKLILHQIGLEYYFDGISDGTDIIHSKPNPEVFLIAAQKLGLESEDCAVVEDAKAGIIAAKKAGMTALALFGDAKECGQEDYNLKSFNDLLNVLE